MWISVAIAQHENRTQESVNGIGERIFAIDLPPDIARQAFYEGVMRRLVWRQPWFMQLLMEDPFFRRELPR